MNLTTINSLVNKLIELWIFPSVKKVYLNKILLERVELTIIYEYENIIRKVST